MIGTFIHFFNIDFETMSATLQKYLRSHKEESLYLLLYVFGDLEQWTDSDE
jgi:hypothetical protein